MSVSDTDYSLLMVKLASFEERLKQLEKDIQELKPKYHPYQSDNPDAPYYRPIYTAYALKKGSFGDAGIPQVWRESLNSNQDHEE